MSVVFTVAFIIVQLLEEMKLGGFMIMSARLQLLWRTKPSLNSITDCPASVMCAVRLGSCVQASQIATTVASVAWRREFEKDYPGHFQSRRERENIRQDSCSHGELTPGHSFRSISSSTHSAALSLQPCKSYMILHLQNIV